MPGEQCSTKEEEKEEIGWRKRGKKSERRRVRSRSKLLIVVAWGQRVARTRVYLAKVRIDSDGMGWDRG